jgi:hypothetical protein
MRETEVWDRTTDTVYAVWFTTDTDEDAHGRVYQHVTVERIAVGDAETGEDRDLDPAEWPDTDWLADLVAERLENGGML